MDYVNRNILVPVALIDTCRALVAKAATEEIAAGMWVTRLSPTGAAPATHGISAGPTGADLAALLPLTTYTADPDGIEHATTTPGDAAAVVALSDGLVTEQQVEAIFSAVVVTDEDPWTTLARLGQKVVQDENSTAQPQ